MGGKVVHAPTQSEAASMLRDAGFERVRIRGSHAVYRNASGDVTVVPCNHPARPVSPVVWANVKKALRIEERRGEYCE